eukprot:1556971-Prymnesium_polylepis.1
MGSHFFPTFCRQLNPSLSQHACLHAHRFAAVSDWPSASTRTPFRQHGSSMERTKSSCVSPGKRTSMA